MFACGRIYALIDWPIQPVWELSQSSNHLVLKLFPQQIPFRCKHHVKVIKLFGFEYLPSHEFNKSLPVRYGWNAWDRFGELFTFQKCSISIFNTFTTRETLKIINYSQVVNWGIVIWQKLISRKTILVYRGSLMGSVLSLD